MVPTSQTREGLDLIISEGKTCHYKNECADLRLRNIGWNKWPDFQFFACGGLLPARGKGAKKDDVTGAVGCLMSRAGSQIMLIGDQAAGETKKAFSTIYQTSSVLYSLAGLPEIWGNYRRETEAQRD